jgi:spermidine synthase
MEQKFKTKTWHKERSIYLSVALISISVLMLEIGLTRIFSVMFEFHYAFLILSTSILGLGVGGMVVHARAREISNPNLKPLEELLPIASGLMALSIPAMTILLIKVSFFQQILFAAMLAFAPFLFGGIFLAVAFRLLPEMSPKVYAFDLIGAAIGSVLIVFALKLGGINVSLLVAVIASIPAGLLCIEESSNKIKKTAACFLMGGLMFLLLFNYFADFFGMMPSSKGADKEMTHLLAHPTRGASLVASRWSAFGRTDLVRDEEDLNEMVFFIDGTAGTSMYRFDKDIGSLDKHEFHHFPGYFPLKLLPEKEKEKVLIIGAGGGREVLLSLLGGAKEITAVEVNKDLVDMMKEYADFNGGIYNDFPGVEVVVEEGRNFIRATKEQYDIIMLTLPVTRSPEGFALTENFLFTVESISDYLDRLKPSGRLIVVVHGELEIYKLIFTSLAALKKRGVSQSEAMTHMYTVGPKMFPVFVLKKSPLTMEEAERVHESMHEHEFSSVSSFIPFIEQVKYIISLDEEIYQEHFMLNESLYLLFAGEINADELIDFADADLSVATDDDPFFYKFNRGIPLMLTLVLIFSTIAMIGGWLVRPGDTWERRTSSNNVLFLFLFSFLGVGFMLIEISLFQKFILFLGQPVYSLSILLFSILIGAGIGSWMSGILWAQRTLFKLRLAAFIVGLIVVIYILFLNQVFVLFLGTPFLTRMIISFLLLAPLGFFMGMPFPLGMKLLAESSLEHYVPRMWGVNGIGSVLGSALAIILAISSGFSYSMLLGAVLYFLIVILFSIGFLSSNARRLKPSHIP